MVEIFEEIVNEIPILHAVPVGKQESALPTIFFYHGFTSSKEMYCYFAYSLAREGFRVVMPEADMHGVRFNGDSEHRLAHFWDILKSNIDELPGFYQHYQERGVIIDGRVGVGGASLGGMTALGAKVRYPWIDATACFMGSGYYLSLAEKLLPPQREITDEQRAWVRQRVSALADYQVPERLHRIADKPLFIWHGLEDELVPAQESQRLMDDLGAHGLLDKVTFIAEEGVYHNITVAALASGVSFFRQHL